MTDFLFILERPGGGGGPGWTQSQTHVYFEANVFELERVLETKTKVKILQVQSIVFEDVKFGHGIAKQSFRHGRGPKGLENSSHFEACWDVDDRDGGGADGRSGRS